MLRENDFMLPVNSRYYAHRTPIGFADFNADVYVPEGEEDNQDNPKISYRGLCRKWNQLSRLQRSIIYIITMIMAAAILWIINKHSKTNNISNAGSADTIKMFKLQNDTVTEKVKEFTPYSSLSFKGPANSRQEAVVEGFQHAWRGYKKYAWGHDNLRPVSATPFEWFALGLTIVDSLDTAFIMGLTDEYEEGKKWIKEELKFTRKKDVNFFEVTIRVLGALLTNYHFSKDSAFLEKAEDLGQRLLSAFSSPSGIPFSDVNLGAKTAHAPDWSHLCSTAEVSTVQVEFTELSRATNNPIFEELAVKVSEKIHYLPKKHGLVPIYLSPFTGQFVPHATITLGARGDSYYEYLLKQWIQTGKTKNFLLVDYMEAIEGVRLLLAKRSTPNKYLFIGEITSSSDSFNPKMDHLTCFLPGTLALGFANGLPSWHMKMAEELLYTCYLTYAIQPTFLAPEITHFNLASTTVDMYTKTADAHSLLRPEFVESLWYMYQLTGNKTYQNWGWEIFQSLEKYARVTNGYTSIANVKNSDNIVPRDMMESFFMSETLKYLYLLFSDDRYLIDLRKFVITTEAHPLPIHNN